ncbi:MAG: peptidase E [Chloroflexi bacterium]|nr:peptidase E [Chloroflexota bacterium]
MGGGGFSMEDTPLLDQYVIAQARTEQPKVCFLAQASGESLDYTLRFYRAFQNLGTQATHLSLFNPHTADVEGFLMEQDVIYVGGGNTKSLLALWREWELDRILWQAGENGTVLAGISAGCICWFENPFSDSIPGRFIRLKGLGYLAGSCSPHYDGEAGRRPEYQRQIAADELPPGIAFDDGAAGHYVDGALQQVVSSRPNAKGYRVERDGDQARETVVKTVYLG